MKRLALAVLLLFVLVGCGSLGVQSPLTHTPTFDTLDFLQRIEAGEMPETPEAAQQYLDDATAAVRRDKGRADGACVLYALLNDRQYPEVCESLDSWYQSNAVPFRFKIQAFITRWHEDGGSANEVATAYFREKILEEMPELKVILVLLRGLETDVSSVPSLPDLSGWSGQPPPLPPPISMVPREQPIPTGGN